MKKVHAFRYNEKLLTSYKDYVDSWGISPDHLSLSRLMKYVPVMYKPTDHLLSVISTEPHMYVSKVSFKPKIKLYMLS